MGLPIIMLKIGETVLNNVPSETKEKIKKSLIDAAIETVKEKYPVKRTVKEWADLSVKVIDEIINRVKIENGFSYIGGKLRFYCLPDKIGKVVISYELYFLDQENNWRKNANSYEEDESSFTDEALEEIKSNVIEFEIVG